MGSKELHTTDPPTLGFCLNPRQCILSDLCSILPVCRVLGDRAGPTPGTLTQAPVLSCSAGAGRTGCFSLPPKPCVSSPAGGAELLALSAKGRLMICHLDPHDEAPQSSRVTSAKAGKKIKQLLSGIGTVSER